MLRVAELMEDWARELGLAGDDVTRWRAAAMLHDALRDAEPAALRPLAPPELREAPGDLLHGPAAATRLRREGVSDGPVLLAVEWHTLGHPDFDRLGRALYLADYLEPGREWASESVAGWHARMPHELDAVTRELAAERLGHALQRLQPLLAPTVGFWNELVHG
jgi:HD superfamily phosphohydrolase YqeK